MFIHLNDLELQKVDFKQAFEPGVIDLGPEVEQTLPLQAKGRAELVAESRGHKQVVADIRLVGEYSTRVESPCARCLEPVSHDLKGDFDLLYRPQGVDGGREEVSISEADTEIGYYSGDGLLLEDVLKEQVLLAIPLRALCREDCRGLCPKCGLNRNAEACSCPSEKTDERWTALAGLKDKLKK